MSLSSVEKFVKQNNPFPEVNVADTPSGNFVRIWIVKFDKELDCLAKAMQTQLSVGNRTVRDQLVGDYCDLAATTLRLFYF